MDTQLEHKMDGGWRTVDERWHHVRVALPVNGSRGEVYLDDRRVLGVRDVSVKSVYDDVCTVTLTFVAQVNLPGTGTT